MTPTDIIIAAGTSFAFWIGWWMRGAMDRWRDRKLMPYRAKCSQRGCDFRVSASELGTALRFAARHEYESHGIGEAT